MSNNSILESKSSKGIQQVGKPLAGSQTSTVNSKPVITTLSPSSQVKVVNRLITFFETK